MIRPSIALLVALLLLIVMHETTHAGFSTIPLQSVVNRELTDDTPEGDGKGGWTDQGKDNSLTGFPTGDIEFAGVPFVVPKQGKAAVLFKGKALGGKFPDWPVDVTIIAPTKCEGSTLYVLALAVHGGGEGAAGEITVEYSDGSKQQIELEYGKHLGGWWDPKAPNKGIIAWTGKTLGGTKIGAYLAPLALKGVGPIKAIHVHANEQGPASLALLGLSVGDKKPEEILPPPKKWVSWSQNGAEGWWPIETPYDTQEKPAAWDGAMTFFKNEAGSFGWTRAAGENLEFEKAPGNPVRFKGICACDTFFYPPLSQAENYAKAVRKYGFNQVRFHSIFDQLTVKNGNYGLLKFNAGRLERFDKIFAELKKQGIYINPSFTFANLFDPSTGIDAADKLRACDNTYYYYDARHQEIFVALLKEFLEHKNPFTGLRYADDPALNMMKALNESSMFFYTVDAAPGVYRLKLQALWNAHLRKTYGSQAKLLEAWRVEGQRSPIAAAEDLSQETIALLGIWNLANAQPAELKRAADQTRFYQSLEENFFKKVQTAVRETGSKALVQGSSWGGPKHLQEIQSAANASLDFTGKHTYWDHPNGGWNWASALFHNEPMAMHPTDHALLCMFQHVEGKPFVITEWQFCMPNDFINDSSVTMAAYGALQNLNANHHFVLSNPELTASYPDNFFNHWSIAGAMATEPLAYNIYVRGDVKPAPVIYRNALPSNVLHDPLRFKATVSRQSDNRFFMLFDQQPVPTEAMLVGGVRLGLSADAKPLWDEQAYRAGHDEKNKLITSITKELQWNYDQGWIAVQTTKTKMIAGFFSEAKHVDGPLSFTLNKAYGVAGFTSLDNQALDQSTSVLVTLTGRQRNTGQMLDELTQGGKRVTDQAAFRVGQRGEPPLVSEPAAVRFELKTRHTKKWTLQPLDLRGLPKGPPITLDASSGTLKAEIDNSQHRALNYLLTASDAATAR